MSYWTGLVEGVQGRREAEYAENLQREQANRQMADRVYQHLLNSRDPQIQQLALSGLMSPLGKRKKGLAGFLGEIETDPRMAEIFARMNEMIPDDGAGVGGGPTPPVAGSAAMSANQPVRPGSAPIELPPAPPDLTSLGAERSALPGGDDPYAPPGNVQETLTQAGIPGMPGLAGAGPGMPPPPPESLYKRRGTGVPTAEEIAEANAAATQRGRISVARAQLMEAGATPEEIQAAIMGMLGAPQNQRMLSAVTQWGVVLPGQTDPVPVLLDQVKGYVTAGGQPLPPGAKMVRMTGGGTGGSMTSTMEDTPESRQQLISMGADPQVVNAGSATGYWRVRQGGDGSIMLQPTEFVPPPRFQTTVQGMDANQNVVTSGVTREGGLQPLTTSPSQQPSPDQVQAQGLLETVNRLIQQAGIPRFEGLPRRPILQPQMDQITREAAVAAGLPYTTYQQLQAATRLPASRQVTPPAGTPAVTQTPTTNQSVAEQVLQEALRMRGQVPNPPAPPAIPTRGRGAGPNR